jgi:hypothetical protein
MTIILVVTQSIKSLVMDAETRIYVFYGKEETSDGKHEIRVENMCDVCYRRATSELLAFGSQSRDVRNPNRSDVESARGKDHQFAEVPTGRTLTTIVLLRCKPARFA